MVLPSCTVRRSWPRWQDPDHSLGRLDLNMFPGLWHAFGRVQLAQLLRLLFERVDVWARYTEDSRGEYYEGLKLKLGARTSCAVESSSPRHDHTGRRSRQWIWKQCPVHPLLVSFASPQPASRRSRRRGSTSSMAPEVTRAAGYRVALSTTMSRKITSGDE